MRFQRSRRSFLQSASWAAAASALDPLTFAATSRESSGTQILREFAYSDVQLTGGPLKEQYDFIHAHYLGLDNDGLLKVYREHAGLPAPGQDPGGWYGPDGFVPGHSLGQYISGLARIGSSTGDPACHAKARQLLQGFGAAVEANSNPFAGPNSEKLWPAYVLDKHIVGLIDACQLSGADQARALLPRVISGALPFISPVSRDRVGKKDPPYDETYVLPENLFTVRQITGEARFRELAVKYLLDAEFFDPLSRGEDVLPGRHAYSHAIALSSAARAYLELGNDKYRTALVNAWRFLDLQRFASGGFGPDEQFVEPHKGALYDSLARTKDHFETPCGSYAAMKLARYLLRFTGDARYGDGLERVIYNALLAVKRPDTNGNFPYYSTYGTAAVKEFYPHKWPCCSGTLVQGVADYVLNVYFQGDDGIYVNLFVPSKVLWSRNGQTIRLIQETPYPAGDSTVLRVETELPATFTVYVRVPGWLRDPPEILVNGRRLRSEARPGTFAAVHRTWSRDDRIEMHLPQDLRTEPIDELHPNTVAILRGPVLYAGLNYGANMSSASTVALASLAAVSGTREMYLQKVGGQQRIFVPFYKLQNESYDLYIRQA
jgi:DUF1680 family protein